MPNQITLTGTQPFPIIPRAPQAQSFLIANLDLVNNIYVGTSPSISPAASNTFTVNGLGTISLTSAQQWYACTDDGATTQLAILPGGTSWAPAPSQIAEVIAPLAAAIATQIAQTGVTLISTPQLMYNVSSGTSGGTGSGLFGVSVNPASGHSAQTDLTAWQNAVGRPVMSTKIYNSELVVPGGWATTATTTVTACMNMGIRACLCYSPSFNPPNATDKANMAASISALKALLVGAGAPAPIVTLWQEPQNTKNNLSASQYINLVHYYANTDANGTGVRSLAQLWYNGAGYHTDMAAAYYPGAAYTDGIAVDYYCAGDFKTGKSLNTWTAIDATKPFGVWEMGNAAGSGTGVTQADMTNYLVSNNTSGPPSIKQCLLGLLAGGRSIDAAMWYQNDNNPTGANYISSSADFRVPLLQQLNDAITSTVSSPGLAISAGSTVTLTPITASAGGGFATAQGISYDITINAIGSASATIPFMLVEFFWHNVDVSGSQAVARQSFMIPVGATGTAGTFINGVGPMTGVLVAVKVQNLDTVTNYVNIVMNSTSRQQNAHRWHWDSANSVSVPGYTLANGNSQMGILATGSFTLGAGATISRLCSMYTGQIWVRLGNSANFTASLAEPAQDQSSPYHEGSSSTADNDLLISSPRSPLLLTLTNNGASSNTISLDVIANDPL